ncbi:oxidoreductase C-terminal domain-containing protein [Streptomyces sp. NPDC058735]
MLGAGTPYTAVPWSWTEQYGVMLQTAGHLSDADSLTVQGDIATFDFAALATAGGQPVGAVAAGRPHDFRSLRTLLDRQCPPRPDEVTEKRGQVASSR